MKDQIIAALKDLGIKEVILDLNETPGGLVPVIEFAMDSGRVIMTNQDFGEGGL